MIWCEIVCDGCNMQLEGRSVHGGRYPAREMEAARKRSRWTKDKDGKHHCPGCGHRRATGHTVYTMSESRSWCADCNHDF